MANKKSYRTPPEVKEQVLRRIKEEGITVGQAANDAGVHETTVYGWLGKGASASPSFAEMAKLQKQNKELLELVGELTLRLSVAQKKN